MNVGTLKQLLAGIPDETPIISQIVDQQGNAWNLHLAVYADNSPMNAILIQLSHPHLHRIPMDNYLYFNGTDWVSAQLFKEQNAPQSQAGEWRKFSPAPAVPANKRFQV